MHPWFELTSRQESFLLREERMLAGRMKLLFLVAGLASFLRSGCGKCHIHQVVIRMDPYMHNGLQFHFVRAGIVCQNLIPSMEYADWFFAIFCCNQGI